MNRAVIILALCLGHGFWSTTKSEEIPLAQLEFFEKEIRPVLVENCYECHSTEGKTKGGLLLDSRLSIEAGGDSGAALVKGQPDKSLLIEAVRYHNRELQMPPKNRLAPAQVAALEKWVAMGAPDPRAKSSASTAASGPGMSIEKGREFWSFKALGSTEPPGMEEHPVDAFIYSKLGKKKLTPAASADKRTLLRRVTYNLTGLPPSIEDIEAFLADESPEAFSKVVDRLLASEHYGVRWGRHWLDVARYADSNGLDENLAYGQAWRYRDYVVTAINRDKPFDQFLVEQMAGDLVPGANRETRTATGFLALGAKVLAEPDRAKLEMDIIDEQLDTFGKAFLGMTFGCVRCHDHKFDPIKQTDYYALAAIFRSTSSLGESKQGAIKHWYEHSFATDEEIEKNKELEATIKKMKSAASSFKSKEIVRLRGEARGKAPQYLAAASRFAPNESLSQVKLIADEYGLLPRILFHCRMHLDYHRDDPLFKKWHELNRRKDVAGILDHYGSLFDEAQSAFMTLRKKDPKAKTLQDPRLEAARAALHDKSGFLAVPAKPEHAFDTKTLAEYHRLMEEARVFESGAPDDHAAMGVADGTVSPTLQVHIRGSHKNLGDPVSRELPEVMRFSQVRPIFPTKSSGRLELARWMADTRHPLTARVIVNRVWGWHFGQALSRTTENFGVLGEKPSHPELLDWLARNFMENGWSIKKLNHLILTSKTYQQASNHHKQDDYALVDPENRLLWRSNQRRLEAEEIRDAILAVSGRIDLSLGGKTVPLRNKQFVFNHTSEDHTTYESLRRAIYLPVVRNNLYPFFVQFDYPDPTMPTGARNSTVIAPQALVMMNDDLVMESADALAQRLIHSSADDRERVSIAWQLAFGRMPEAEETEEALRYIEKTLSHGRVDSARVDSVTEHRAWSRLCHGLFASNEFIYLR